MSQEREIIDVATGREISLTEALEKDPEEYKRLRAERKTRFSRVLERGIIADRLQVDLPPTLWGEWVPRDKASIFEREMLGFKIDTEFATKRALHDQGTGESIVGDCVFMVQDIEDHNLLEEIRKENFESANGKPGRAARLQGEEREFAAQSRTIGMPTIEESVAKSARKAELQAALQQRAQPTQPSQAARVIR